jgi:hypothetical protein
MGTGVVSGPHAQKDVVSGPNAQNWLQAAQDLFDGLQNTWAHHMVSKVHGLTTMVSKMQKLCIWAEMYQNDGLRAIYPVSFRLFMSVIIHRIVVPCERMAQVPSLHTW